MYQYDINTTRHIFQSILKGRVLYDNPVSLYRVVGIAAYLEIPEEKFASLLPGTMHFDMIPRYLGFFHQLIKEGYHTLAELYIRSAKLPLSLLQNRKIGYQQFKKQCPDAHNLEEYLSKRARPRCVCERCTQYREDHTRYPPNRYVPHLKYPGRIRFFPQQTALPKYLELKQAQAAQGQNAAQN